MDRESYLEEVEKRLRNMFGASRDGYRTPEKTRHQLEGFMQAGVFMGLASKAELYQLMNDVHEAVYGKSIEERKAERLAKWEVEAIDYSEYEAPTYERKRD
jgi:hypothetical protein